MILISLFFWRFRSVVNKEIIGLFAEFHIFSRKASMPHSVAHFLSRRTSDINSFRPTKLVRSVYKILVKVMASRLRKVIGKVICELDIEKAYGHMSWDFLMTTLEKMGFPSKWRRWPFFLGGISTVCFSVLVNGEATGYLASTENCGKVTLYPLCYLFWW